MNNNPDTQNNTNNNNLKEDKNELKDVKTARWFTKDERIRIEELVELLNPHIKPEGKEIWDEICAIIFLVKEKNKPSTHFFVGEVIDKVKRHVRQKGDRYGKLFYLLRLKIDTSDNKVIDFWVFDDVVDDYEKTWPLIQRVVVGERYEFEAQRWNKTDYHLRALIKLEKGK